jgi:hypothetical protein
MFDPNFAAKLRNVRIGLTMASHLLVKGHNHTHVGMSWLFHTTFHFLFVWSMNLCFFAWSYLAWTIRPGKKLNVMLQLLIEELKELWKGVKAYDVFKRPKFNLRVAYLWSVHDFPASIYFFGCRTHGRLACPYCGTDTDCFHLAHG